MNTPSISAGRDGQFQISGDLTFTTVSRFLDKSLPMLRGEADSLVFDLADVSRADSAGLALLIEWKRHAHHLNKVLSFAHIPEQLLNMASASGLEALLDLPVSSEN